MKILIPIAVLISSSVLVACSDGVLIGEEETSGGADIVFEQTNENTRNAAEEWFDEAEVLAATGQDETLYLEQLGALLTHYVQITKEEGYPTGLNFEITNALLGQNTKQIAVLDADHPKINEDGEIVDSWGTPYYFHSETSEDISIQSAGADLMQYTSDDITYEALNDLAGAAEVSSDDTDDADDGGLTLGFAFQYTPSTFDTFGSGEMVAE